MVAIPETAQITAGEKPSPALWKPWAAQPVGGGDPAGQVRRLAKLGFFLAERGFALLAGV